LVDTDKVADKTLNTMAKNTAKMNKILGEQQQIK
jgi:hypothetical protein